MQGPEAAETKVLASALCTLLLAEQDRHHASSTSATELDQQQHSSNAASQPDDEATASNQTHQTLQALSQLEAAGQPELSGQEAAGILQGTVSVFELVTELLFMAGLHGRVVHTELVSNVSCLPWHFSVQSAIELDQHLHARLPVECHGRRTLHHSLQRHERAVHIPLPARCRLLCFCIDIIIIIWVCRQGRDSEPGD